MLNIISTPIGNIKDISLRAVETLVDSDVIVCEDTRTFVNFYNKIQEIYNLKPTRKQKIIYLFKENEFVEAPKVIELLQQDLNVSLVSECGTPLISDPGELLLKYVIKHNIPYTAIPGATAYINALVLSGFGLENNLFLGFLPKKPNEIKKLITKYQISNIKLVFYESPMRINKTLELIESIAPDSKVCVCREMTKKFEEVLVGTPGELKSKIYKGEITVILKLCMT